tara:strand:- start:3509 stop:3910 length:402 start_codon:yes stop_codon:yes gene_type:complete
METLPTDIIIEIKEYIPHNILYNVSKSYFNKYYTEIITNYSLKNKNFKKYVLNIIKKDCIFQFRVLIDRNFTTWLNTKKWIFKNITHFNYLEFMKYISIENNSNKCLEILNNKLNKTSKKKYKNRTKNIVWSN